MKKINQNSPIFTLLIIVVFSVFYGCEKNPIDNFKIIVSPALFEYTASIRIIDAADSTVPPNLKIVLSPENEGDLYDILGKNKLAISDDGYIQVGLKPSIKPDAANPVVIQFQLQAENYISENYSLVYHLGEYSINKTFTLMNKSNLPRGVSYTHVTVSLSNGVIANELNINLGGGKGGSTLKSVALNELNKLTLKAGTKFFYWNYDKSIPGWNKWVKTEVMDSGQLEGNAFFYQWFPGGTCYAGFENSYIDDKGVLKAIPANSALYGVGGWHFDFSFNNKNVWPEYDGEPSATLQLSLPKSGLNMKTGKLYQKGDVINIYNYKRTDGFLAPEIIFEHLVSETLSESSDIDPDYFKLKPIQVNSMNRIIVGELFPIVTFDQYPVIKLQGEISPLGDEYPHLPVSQFLYKVFQFDNENYQYSFGYWSSSSLNQPDHGGFNFFKFLPGSYLKIMSYPVSELINNTVNTSINEKLDEKSVIVSQSGPNPFDVTIPSAKVQRTDISFSVKCGTTVIRPSFFYYVRQVSDPYDEWDSWYYGGYISQGSGASYLLKVGGAYEFKINFEGKSIMVIDTIKSSNTAIVIDDDSFCTF